MKSHILVEKLKFTKTLVVRSVCKRAENSYQIDCSAVKSVISSPSEMHGVVLNISLDQV